jgi:hypothetical protein
VLLLLLLLPPTAAALWVFQAAAGVGVEGGGSEGAGANVCGAGAEGLLLHQQHQQRLLLLMLLLAGPEVPGVGGESGGVAAVAVKHMQLNGGWPSQSLAAQKQQQQQ